MSGKSIAKWMETRLSGWNRCHNCRCYFKGNTRVGELPATSDGVLFNGTCPECDPPLPPHLQEPNKGMRVIFFLAAATVLHGGLLLLINL